MPNLCRAAAVLLLSFASVVNAQPAPREAVDAVADAIARRYFDPARGGQIADALRRDASAGAFDTLADPQALADALTARLRPLDRHFRVRWNGAADGARSAAPRRASAPTAPNGIATVELRPDGIGVLRMTEFAHFEFDDERAPARVAIDDALARLSASRAMIIDLRGNRGGSPSMVGYLASAFLTPGTQAYNIFRTRTESYSEAPATPYAKPRMQVPVYVLIDGGTASAAEAFTYTLQSAKRASVIGARSAGAANPGGEVDIGGGFSVFVSDGSPVNPITHTNWEAVGVAPDVAVAQDTAFDAALGLANARR